MMVYRFASVWDAIEENQVDSAALKLRSRLMMTLRDDIAESELSQGDLAKLLGVSQSQVLELLRGKINSFSADTLLDMLTKAGLQLDLGGHSLVTEAESSSVDTARPDVS